MCESPAGACAHTAHAKHVHDAAIMSDLGSVEYDSWITLVPVRLSLALRSTRRSFVPTFGAVIVIHALRQRFSNMWNLWLGLDRNSRCDVGGVLPTRRLRRYLHAPAIQSTAVQPALLALNQSIPRLSRARGHSFHFHS